jgi:multidrug efflux system membrane fusion protein
LVLLLGLTAAVGCGRSGPADPSGGKQAPPWQTKVKRNVDLVRGRRDRMAADLKTVGFLEAEAVTDVAAGVPGVIDEVLFREGQWVDRGTVLVKIDQRRYETGLELARANEQRSASALAVAKQMDQINTLSGPGISGEDKAKTAGAVRVAEGDLNSARAARVLAELNLDRSRVRAPYAGQINQRKVAAGDYVEEKTIVATIADLSKLRLVGFIPEKAAPTVRKLVRQEEAQRAGFLVGGSMAGPWTGAAALMADAAGETPAGFKLQFTLGAFPRQTFTGRIFYLSTVASPDTHMFECKAEVPVRGVKEELRPGYTARITCPLPGHESVPIVPEEAVRASERGDIVFRPKPVLKDGAVDYWAAEQVTISEGVRTPGLVEIRDGLDDGDWIVQKGAETLEDGTPIHFPEELEETVRKWYEARHP